MLVNIETRQIKNEIPGIDNNDDSDSSPKSGVGAC